MASETVHAMSTNVLDICPYIPAPRSNPFNCTQEQSSSVLTPPWFNYVPSQVMVQTAGLRLHFTTRFESTSKIPAKCMLKYRRFSWCLCMLQIGVLYQQDCVSHPCGYGRRCSWYNADIFCACCSSVISTSKMVADILVAAEPVLNIRNCISEPKKFLRLGDSVLQTLRSQHGRLQVGRHYETCKYYQSTSKARPNVLQSPTLVGAEKNLFHFGSTFLGGVTCCMQILSMSEGFLRFCLMFAAASPAMWPSINLSQILLQGTCPMVCCAV